MSGGTILLIVLTLFFIIGVTVGIITVVAISTLRKEKERVGLPRSSARPNRNVSPDPAGTENGIDDQDPGVSGVPGHWDGPTEDPGTSDNRPWWDDDSESSSLS